MNRGPLSYLTITKLKNQIKQILRTPSQLIYAIFMIAIFVFISVVGNREGIAVDMRDIRELNAILMVFFTIMFFMLFFNAYSQGSSMFTMSDVNMVFPTPINPHKVLFYGLFRQLGLSFALGFFILFQYSWLHTLYGLSYVHLIVIILGYALTIFMAQLCAMALFCRTSHDPAKKRVVRLVFYALIVVLLGGAVAYVLPALQNADVFAAIPLAVEYFNLLPVLCFPVSGWTGAITGAIITGDIFTLVIFSAAIVAFGLVMILLIVKSKHNFYEDVIKAAEVAQSAITAKKEGQIGEVVSKNVKVGKTGLNKGLGASAIYYKHMRENRRSGMLFISNMSLLFAAIVIFMSIFMRDAGIFAVFMMATYMQIFSVALGRFTRELSKPYIYLIPESPLKKLYYAIKESLISSLLEAILLFAVVGLIVGADPLDIVLCILARVSFSLLYTAGNIAVERVFGSVNSRFLVMFFYILVLLVMMVPGILLAVLFTVLFNMVLATELSVVYLAFIIANIPVSILVMFLCRNLLQYAELNNK